MTSVSPEQVSGASQARFHVQVELSWIKVAAPPVFTPCRGRVLRVFSGSSLAPGEVVRFRFPLLARSRAIPPPEDGSAWLHVDDLASAQVLEVFLDGSPPELKICDGGFFCRPLAAPTDAPVTQRPTRGEVLEASLQSNGRLRLVCLVDSVADTVAKLLASHGGHKKEVERSHVWIFPTTGRRPLTCTVEDYEDVVADPETYLPPLLKAVRPALVQFGRPPRLIVHVHSYPENEEVARSLVAELLKHRGLAHTLQP